MSNRNNFLKRHWRLVSPIFAFLLDLILLNLSFITAVLVRSGSLVLYTDYTKPVVFINLVFLVISPGLGLYRSRYILTLGELRFGYKRLTLILALSTMAFLYFIKKGQFYSRAIILITFILFYLILAISHWYLKKYQDKLIDQRLIGFNTIVIGTGKWSYHLFRKISDIFGGYFHIVGFVQEDDEIKEFVYEKLEGQIIGTMSQFEELVALHSPDIVFIASDTMDPLRYTSIYRICEEKHIQLKMVSSQVSNVLHNSRIRDISGVSLVMEKWRISCRKFNGYLKRIFDLGFIFLIAPVILPLGLLIGILVKISSRGPVLFKQKRSLSQDGASFNFYKFRSMYRNADEMKAGLFEQNEANGALFKIKNDPRVTPLGRLIRKLSLDELPQFINVLKGDMSIVGPRPLPVEDFTRIENEGPGMNGDWYKQRDRVKPGITGLWQISGRSDISFEEMLYLDLYYVEHQSLLFDLEILFETIPTVLFGRGAY